MAWAAGQFLELALATSVGSRVGVGAGPDYDEFYAIGLAPSEYADIVRLIRAADRERNRRGSGTGQLDVDPDEIDPRRVA